MNKATTTTTARRTKGSAFIYYALGFDSIQLQFNSIVSRFDSMRFNLIQTIDSLQISCFMFDVWSLMLFLFESFCSIFLLFRLLLLFCGIYCCCCCCFDWLRIEEQLGENTNKAKGGKCDGVKLSQRGGNNKRVKCNSWLKLINFPHAFIALVSIINIV